MSGSGSSDRVVPGTMPGGALAADLLVAEQIRLLRERATAEAQRDQVQCSERLW